MASRVTANTTTAATTAGDCAGGEPGGAMSPSGQAGEDLQSNRNRDAGEDPPIHQVTNVQLATFRPPKLRQITANVRQTHDASFRQARQSHVGNTENCASGNTSRQPAQPGTWPPTPRFSNCHKPALDALQMRGTDDGLTSKGQTACTTSFKPRAAGSFTGAFAPSSRRR